MKKDKKIPSLSERNNNPLNIRATQASNWEGQTGCRKGFAVFENDGYGYRAALYLLLKYMVVYKLRTPEAIITRWAPPSENFTKVYISKVCKRSHGKLSQQGEITKWSELVCLIFCMTEVERGRRVTEREKNGLLLACELIKTHTLPTAFQVKMNQLIDNDDEEE